MSSDSAILNVQFKLEREIIGKLRIPKFKFAYGFEVSEIMEKMGLKLNMNKDAEMLQTLHGDDTSKIIKYMEVCHTSYIEVNEQGTEAVATTLVLFGGGGPPPTDFVADHPFVFMIREDSSESLVFLGVVVNPLLS